jgi:hypothetical protein
MQPQTALAARVAKASPIVSYASLSLLAFALSACGGGDTDTPLTLDALRADADAVNASRLPVPATELADRGAVGTRLR